MWVWCLPYGNIGVEFRPGYRSNEEDKGETDGIRLSYCGLCIQKEK